MSATAFQEKISLDVEDKTISTTVAENDYAKLSYYFYCIISCLSDTKNLQISNLTNYSSYYNLTNKDKENLYQLCEILSPSQIKNKIFFTCNDKKILGKFSIKFLKITETREISALHLNLNADTAFTLSGEKKNINMIFLANDLWLENYYFSPMRKLKYFYYNNNINNNFNKNNICENFKQEKEKIIKKKEEKSCEKIKNFIKKTFYCLIIIFMLFILLSLIGYLLFLSMTSFYLVQSSDVSLHFSYSSVCFLSIILFYFII